MDKLKRRAAEMLALGRPKKAVLEELKLISRSTLWRWEKDKEFQAEVGRLRSSGEAEDPLPRPSSAEQRIRAAFKVTRLSPARTEAELASCLAELELKDEPEELTVATAEFLGQLDDDEYVDLQHRGVTTEEDALKFAHDTIEEVARCDLCLRRRTLYGGGEDDFDEEPEEAFTER